MHSWRTIVSLMGLVGVCTCAGCSGSRPSAPSASVITDVYSFSAGVPATESRQEDHFSFSVHDPGAIQVTIESWRTPYQGDGADYLRVELLKGSSVLSVMRNCAVLAGDAGAPCTSRVTATHPR
jgi:hypothetical protein